MKKYKESVKSYSCFLDVNGMGHCVIFEKIQKTLQGVVFPLTLILALPPEQQ